MRAIIYVRTTTPDLEAMNRRLKKIPRVREVHNSEDGRLIAVIHGADLTQILATIERARRVKSVESIDVLFVRNESDEEAKS